MITLTLSLALAWWNPQASESQARVPVPSQEAPPQISLAEAHRFLTQATFGPRPGDVEALQAIGIEAWMDQQLQATSAYDSPTDGYLTHIERMIEIAEIAEPNTDWYAGGNFNYTWPSRQLWLYQFSAYLDHVLGATAPGRELMGRDELRQRVAYAWSELLISPIFSGAKGRGTAMAYMADVLSEHALGDFRAMLLETSRSPSMGIGLSSRGNTKFNPLTGQRPDENYAREIMQLFSIGLYQMNLDGSPDRDGNPMTYPDPGTGTVPSYTQQDVVEFAKIFTGFELRGMPYYGAPNKYGLNLTVPMDFFPSYHEDEVAEGGDGLVTILGTTIALNSGTDGSGLEDAVDILIQHPNTGPFLAKHLITNMVTANPSPGYVARVAAVYNDDGQGVRGNLGAMVRAMLLDPEARTQAAANRDSFGMVKEPFLAWMQALRALDVKPLPGWKSIQGVSMADTYWFPGCQQYLAQAPIRSPSPFNWFHPDFSPPDSEFLSRGLKAPSMQIQTGESLIGFDSLALQALDSMEANRIAQSGMTLEQFGAGFNNNDDAIYYVDLSDELGVFELALDGTANGDFQNIQSEPDKKRAARALMRHLAAKLLGRPLSEQEMNAFSHYLIHAAGANAPNGQNVEEARRVTREAVRMLLNSPSYRVQK